MTGYLALFETNKALLGDGADSKKNGKDLDSEKKDKAY